MYAISAEARGLEKVMHLLADAVLRPHITTPGLQAARLAAKYEWEDMQMRPDQETILLEKVHAAAWGDNTLGLPRYCPPENIDNITRDHILSYMRLNFQPPRIVVSGVGVEHNELVDLTKMYFVSSQPAWEEKDFNITGPNQPDKSVAKYIGGYLKVSTPASWFVPRNIIFLSYFQLLSSWITGRKGFWSIQFWTASGSELGTHCPRIGVCDSPRSRLHFIVRS